MRFFLFLVIVAALLFAGAGALESARPAGALYVTPRPTDDLLAALAAAPSAAPTASQGAAPAPAATAGPDHAATAAAALLLAQADAQNTQAAGAVTAWAKTEAAEQTADARAAWAFERTRQAGDAAATGTQQALANTQAAATRTAAPATQAYLAAAEARRTQIVVDDQARRDSRDRWGWVFIAGAIGLAVALVAAGLAFYDWLAGRTAVERASADRIRVLAQEEAQDRREQRARRQAILAQAQARPAAPETPAPRLPIEAGGEPLPRHPPETMHVLYVLARCLDLAGDTSTALPTAEKLKAAGIHADARQAAVAPLKAAGLVETTPGGGTRVAGGLTLRQLYDLIYAGGLAPAPALLEAVPA